MKNTTGTLVISISDSSGREIRTGTFIDVNLNPYIHSAGEDCDCTPDECDCGFFGDYMISIFELPTHLLKDMREYSGHSTHFLSEFGEELCLGDYV